MYPVPATPRAYHPCFTRDIVQAVLVVPQGLAIVNSKPYPACLFSRRGRPSTDAPGVQISISQRRRRKHLHQCQAVKSGTPPHQLNRRRYGAGIFKFGVPGSGVQSRTPETHRVCSHPTANHTKRHVVLLLAEPTWKTLRCQELSGPGPKSCAWPAADTQLPTQHRAGRGVRWQYRGPRR